MMTASPEQPGKIKPGDIIAEKYRVERTLGEGGMGLVVAATHVELGSRRAIKVMLPEAASTPMAIERFLREARAAAELKSQHVAHVFDVGRLGNGAPFMVLEHLEGQDLGDRIEKSGALPVDQAAQYIIQACDALAEAHGRGIVHRDLKPGNLFLAKANDGSYHIKVLDFGISKLLAGDDGAKTSTGALMGSPLYMAPEQIESLNKTDARCDIWALGVTLYELITNTCPFDSDSVMGILSRIAQIEPQPPSAVQKDIPKGLDKVILRCLRKNPAERYQNVGELCRALAPFAPKSSLPEVERIERIVGAWPRQPNSPALPAGPSALDVDPHSTTVSASEAQTIARPVAQTSQRERSRILPLAALAFAFLAAMLAGAVLMSQFGKTSDAESPGQTSAIAATSTPTAPPTGMTPVAPTTTQTVAPPASTPANTAPTSSAETIIAPANTSAPTKKTKGTSTSGPPPRY